MTLAEAIGATERHARIGGVTDRERVRYLERIDELRDVIEVAGLSDSLEAFDVGRDVAEREALELLGELRELVAAA